VESDGLTWAVRLMISLRVSLVSFHLWFRTRTIYQHVPCVVTESHAYKASQVI
jgi:hypothetical protein